MSVDMSGPLSSMPAGTTQAEAFPAGELPKTPSFVTGVNDTRCFFAWLKTLCPSSLSAQMKGKKLMNLPGTAEGFRATVSALQSFDGSKVVTFHTFSLLEDRCVRLLVKNLGRQMSESVSGRSLKPWDSVSRAIKTLRAIDLRLHILW